MKKYLCFVLSFLVWMMASGTVYGQESIIPGAEEHVNIEIIVNVIGNTDASDVEEHIRRANEILNKFNINLEVKKINRNVKVGDNDGNLTEAEGDQAQQDGESEIENTFQDEDGSWTGKGMKVTLANNTWTEQPNNNGWARHRNPVVFAEEGDPCVGNIIAHELVHALTVTDHRNDPNNLMNPTTPRGGEIDPCDLREIWPHAIRRGERYWVIDFPPIEPSDSDVLLCSHDGTSRAIHAQAGIFDDHGDVFPLSSHPAVRAADITEVSVYAPRPQDPTSYATIEVDLDGLFFVDSFFDVTYEIDFDTDPITLNPEFRVLLHVFNGEAGLQAEAQYIDLFGGSTLPLPVDVHMNEKFDVDGAGNKIPWSSSLETTIPIELVQLNLQSVVPIAVTARSQMTIVDLPDSFTDVTESAPLKVRIPCDSPRLCFTRSGVVGSGFPMDIGEVEILLDGMPVGSAFPDSNDKFVFEIPPDVLAPWAGEDVLVRARQIVPTGDPDLLEFRSAYGHLHYCPGGRLSSDINGDCKTDLKDVYDISKNWLAGT